MKKVYETIELDLDQNTIDGLAAFALEKIKDDKQALVEYAAVHILTRILEDEEEMKRIAEK